MSQRPDIVTRPNPSAAGILGRQTSLLTAVAHATFAVYGGMVTAIGPTVPSIAGDFALTLGEAGTIFAVGGVGFILVVFLGGAVADALGKRGVLVAGLLAAAVGSVGMGLSPNFGLLLAAAFVGNVGSGLLESAVGGLVVDLHPKRRTAALNLVHSFFGWGALAGPLFAGALLVAAGWRWVYVGLALPFTVLALFTVRQRFPPPSAEQPIRWGDVRTLLGSRLIRLAILGILLYVAGELSLSAWGFPYLETVRGYPTMVASLGVSILWAAIAIGRWASAGLSAHLSPARLVQAGSCLCAAGTVLLLLSPVPVLALAALAVAGLGASAIYPTIMSVACARFPRFSGTVTGLITTATGLGVLLGPAAVGRLGDVLGLQQALLAVVVAMLLVAAIYQSRSAE